MIKGSEHTDITTLGQMQAVVRLMSTIAPHDAAIRAQWHEITSKANAIVNQQWDRTMKLISEDDT